MKGLHYLLLAALLLSLQACSMFKSHDSTPKKVVKKVEVGGSSDNGSAGGLKSVFFAFNSAELTDEAVKALKQNAGLLVKYPNVKIQLEGHCDERGNRLDNIKVGRLRNETVQKFLIANGVDAKRISTISFGKEKPNIIEENDVANKQNRRVNFVIAYR